MLRIFLFKNIMRKLFECVESDGEDFMEVLKIDEDKIQINTNPFDLTPTSIIVLSFQDVRDLIKELNSLMEKF